MHISVNHSSSDGSFSSSSVDDLDGDRSATTDDLSEHNEEQSKSSASYGRNEAHINEQSYDVEGVVEYDEVESGHLVSSSEDGSYVVEQIEFDEKNENHSQESIPLVHGAPEPEHDMLVDDVDADEFEHNQPHEDSPESNAFPHLRESITSYLDDGVPLLGDNRLGGEENNTQKDDAEAEDKPVRRSSTPRQKVKNRYCKAAVMICVVWSTTVILISIVLGMDWFNQGPDGYDTDNLCTLCGDNGLDFKYDDSYPTRQPASSSSQVAYPIDYPPANLAEVCSPTIRLNHGSKESKDLVEGCIKACLPALCCLVNKEEGREGLSAMLGLDWLNDNQVSAYLTTVGDCYIGDGVEVCDVYDEWCSTLYSLEYVLKESMPSHFFNTCYRNQQSNEADIIVASYRSINPKTAQGECDEICHPLTCCYHDGDANVPNAQIMRKRSRHHTAEGESWLRRRTEEEQCQYFNSQDAVNIQICNAYAPFCDQNYDNTRDSVALSSEPSGVPTQMQSLQPSIEISRQPTGFPMRVESSIPSPRTSSPSFQPTVSINMSNLPSMSPSSAKTQTIISPTYLPSSLTPSSIPSSTPTSYSSSLQSMSLAPSNAKNTSTPTINPSSSFIPTRIPSFQPSATHTIQPSNYTLSATPTQQPSSESSLEPSIMQSMTPSIAQESAPPSVELTEKPSVKLSMSPSAQPSVEPTNEESMSPSVELTENPSMHSSTPPSIQSTEKPSMNSSTPSMSPSIISPVPSTSPTPNGTNTPSVEPSEMSNPKPSKVGLSIIIPT